MLRVSAEAAATSHYAVSRRDRRRVRKRVITMSRGIRASGTTGIATQRELFRREPTPLRVARRVLRRRIRSLVRLRRDARILRILRLAQQGLVLGHIGRVDAGARVRGDGRRGPARVRVCVRVVLRRHLPVGGDGGGVRAWGVARPCGRGRGH